MSSRMQIDPSGRNGRRMKIAVVDDNEAVYGYASGDPSAAGGAERYTWLLIRALAASGWSATIGVRASVGTTESVPKSTE